MNGYLIVTDIHRLAPNRYRLTGLYASPARGGQLDLIHIETARNHDIGDRIPYEVPGP